jgi:L-asparagine transporter-like permease
MKTIIKTLIISFVIHFIYIVGVLVVGYLQTRNYKSDIENAWDNVGVLQNEVAFGVIGSPFILLYTFIGVALISGLTFFLYSKAKKDASPNIG